MAPLQRTIRLASTGPFDLDIGHLRVCEKPGRRRPVADKLVPDGSGRLRTGCGRWCDIVDSLQASAKELFVAELNRLRLEAGNPSLSDLVARGKGKYSKSTLDDHLAGRRVMIPNWRITSAFVNACLAIAKETGLTDAGLGTIEEWRVRWRAAFVDDRDAVSPIRDPHNVATYTMVSSQPQAMADDSGLNLEDLSQLALELSESSSRATGDTTAGITAITRRLEKDLSRLGDSLSADTGLLVVTSGPTIGTRFAVEHDLVTIGRDPNSDVFLDNPTVSRRHAVIHRYGTNFTVRDLGSRNSSFLHQQQLADETPLNSYDELQIGVFRMLFVQGASVRNLRDSKG
jgi:hypothetical protein